MDTNTRLVYSSDDGIIAGYYGNKKETKNSKNSKNKSTKTIAVKDDGIVRVQRDSKGRRGKTATIITGIPGTADTLADIATILKKKCGTGGSAKDGIIVIQGDKRELIVEELKAQGFTVKIAGG